MRPAETTTPGDAAAGAPAWQRWLGLNASTTALLAAILLITAATELWSPLVPEYLKALSLRANAGDAAILLLIGAYGFYRDGLEAINYFLGGGLAGRFNTRRSLLFFNALPLVGLCLLAAWPSRLGVFVAVPFIFVWDSIAGPATITVVGAALPSDRRTMAFSLQAIIRRVSRILAALISAPLIWRLGRVQGVRADAAIAIAFVVGAAAIQYHFMRTASRDEAVMIHRPRKLLRRFSPDLRRLLMADVFARIAEGMAGPFIIVYCVSRISTDSAAGAALYQSVLLNIQWVTNIILYVLVGPLASRAGLAKKPYIGLTFVFFALFPLSLVVLGPALGFAGMAMAFVIGGFREIGEPARKAMVADLVPADVRTQATGLYWSVRSAGVMWASPVGAILWIFGERIRPGWGPAVAFSAAAAFGFIGAIGYFAQFGRGREAPPPPITA